LRKVSAQEGERCCEGIARPWPFVVGLTRTVWRSNCMNPAADCSSRELHEPHCLVAARATVVATIERRPAACGMCHVGRARRRHASASRRNRRGGGNTCDDALDSSCCCRLRTMVDSYVGSDEEHHENAAATATTTRGGSSVEVFVGECLRARTGRRAPELEDVSHGLCHTS